MYENSHTAVGSGDRRPLSSPVRPLPGMIFVDAPRVRRALSMVGAIDALEAAFAGVMPSGPLRSSVDHESGELLLMPASGGALGAGVKLVSIAPGNPQRGLPLIGGVYVLFEPVTLRPCAVIDTAALTALRTSAVSGLATRHLARPDARTLTLFGAGVQAHAHLEAMLAVRPGIEEVRVVPRDAARGELLLDAARETGRTALLADAASGARADVICTCTTSPVPVLHGKHVAPGAHVNAMGAYTATTREVDGALVARARVVVEQRAVAAAEAGDLVLAIAEGAVGADPVAADLAAVVRGEAVRRDPGDVTLFKSVGMAAEDLVLAAAIHAAQESSR